MTPLLTLPFTTKYLSLSDFGYLNIFVLCLVPFRVLTEYGAGYIIYSNWFKLDKNEQGELIFSLLAVATVMTVIALLIVGSFSDLIFSGLIGKDWGNIKPVSWLLFLAVINLIPVTIFDFWVVIEKKAILNSVIKTIEIIAGAILMVLIARQTRNYISVITGTVLLGTVLSAVQMYFISRISHLAINKKHFKIIKTIGSPIFIRSLFNHIRMQFDKIVIVRLFGATQFALYTFSGRFNQMFGEFSTSLSKAYQPFMFKGLADKNLDIGSLRTIFFLWSYAGLIFCAFLLFWGDNLISIFTNGLFADAYPLVILYTCNLALSFPFLGNGEVIIHFQKIKYILVVTILQAIIFSGLALVLIPQIGPEGGIVALWFGALFSSVLDFWKKMQMYGKVFIEYIVGFYVLAYHVAVLFKYFQFENVALTIVIVVIIAMTLHLYYLNRMQIYKLFFYLKFKMSFLLLTVI